MATQPSILALFNPGEYGVLVKNVEKCSDCNGSGDTTRPGVVNRRRRIGAKCSACDGHGFILPCRCPKHRVHKMRGQCPVHRWAHFLGEEEEEAWCPYEVEAIGLADWGKRNDLDVEEVIARLRKDRGYTVGEIEDLRFPVATVYALG